MYLRAQLGRRDIRIAHRHDFTLSVGQSLLGVVAIPDLVVRHREWFGLSVGVKVECEKLEGDLGKLVLHGCRDCC